MSVATISRLPRVRPIVEMGVGTLRTAETAALWDVDRWDAADAVWSGLEPYWVDVTCNVHEVTDLFVGRERSTGTWEVGTAEVLLDNRSGWADYPRIGVAETYLPVRPGVPIRVGVAVDGLTNDHAVWKWRGFVDAANPSFDPSRGEMVTLLCIDAKGEAGRGELAAVDPAVGASELVHQRLGRILDLQQWATEWRDVQTSGVQLVATTLGVNAVDAMNRAADSAGGVVFGDVDGRVGYRGYGWQLFAANTEPDYTIGNVQGPIWLTVPLVEDPAGTDLFQVPDGSTAVGGGLWAVPGIDEDPDSSGLWRVITVQYAGDVCPTGWDLSFARADFTNRVVLQRTDDDVAVNYDDQADIDLYGVEPFPLTDIETLNTTEMNNLGTRILRARNFALAPRVAAVTLNVATAENVLALVLNADPRTPTLVLCRHRGENGRGVINKLCLVTGMRHRITPSAWECILMLDDASPWRIGASEAVWDEAEWDQADWAAMPVPI